MKTEVPSELVRPDAQWIRTRKKLVAQIKREVQKRLGEESPDLVTYGKRYDLDLRKRWQVSTKAELLAEIERVDLVYGGDFHAFGQAQRTHLKILRGISNERPVVLALECFHSRHQKWLDAFLTDKISLESLRSKTRWDREWGFPWENYRPLLELAQRRGFRLLALNTHPGPRSAAILRARDREAARLIREAYLRHSGSLIYIIFGDLHLAEEHLPMAVRRQFKRGRDVRDLIVHLNSERIYFQLAAKALDLTTDVVRLGVNQFCVLSSPPWIQWQSYLLFLEKTVDQGLEDDGEWEDEYDHTDEVAAMIRLAGRDLGLEFKVDDLAIYSSDDNRLWRHIEMKLKASEREMARQLLTSGRSFFLPRGGVGYLSRSTVNHAAALAGQYIHARLCRRLRPLWKFPNDFPALIWSEAVAFFISKLINHKRQSETLVDLKAQLALVGPEEQGREAMKLALEQRLREMILLRQGRRRKLQIRPRRRASYAEAARILGSMMGERLYLAHRSRRIKNKELIQLLKMDVCGRDFARRYEGVLRKLDATPGRKSLLDEHEGIKSKKERL